jgi:hypothetical protein
MSMNEREATDKWIEENNANPWSSQNEHGIDLNALKENLKLTMSERVERGIRRIALVKEIRRAGYDSGLHRDTEGA